MTNGYSYAMSGTGLFHHLVFPDRTRCGIRRVGDVPQQTSDEQANSWLARYPHDLCLACKRLAREQGVA